MKTLKGSKLNNLLTNWQQGAVYTATWLTQQGFSSSAIAGYCQSNWLRSIGRSAFVKQEAKDSSAIENIITTQDDLYRSDSRARRIINILYLVKQDLLKIPIRLSR